MGITTLNGRLYAIGGYTTDKRVMSLLNALILANMFGQKLCQCTRVDLVLGVLHFKECFMLLEFIDLVIRNVIRVMILLNSTTHKQTLGP